MRPYFSTLLPSDESAIKETVHWDAQGRRLRQIVVRRRSSGFGFTLRAASGGARVSRVDDNGAASEAGLKAGELVVR